MGQGKSRLRPKIRGLIDLHDEHPDAFEATLIERGLRYRDVGSADFTWADMHAVIATLAYDSPLMRAVNGGDWFWYGPYSDLLAGIYDAAAAGTATQAQRQKIKSSEVPKPLIRPWQKRKEVSKLGNKPRLLSELDKLLGW